MLALNKLIKNQLMTRAAWLQRLIDPRRDIDAECGHPVSVTLDDYRRAFRRGDIAKRIVGLYPEETWAVNPEIYEVEDPEETDFEKEWNKLQTKFQFYPVLQRADLLSGIGRFGVVLLGIDDGRKLSLSVDGINERGESDGNKKHKLIYLRAFSESAVTVKSLETNSSNPRYGQPLLYDIRFNVSALGSPMDDELGSTQAAEVHWSRIIHLADNRIDSEIYGAPRLEVVFDRLLDLKKITGGSGEMFWKGGFPGLSIETPAGIDENTVVDFDKEATKEQIENYMNGLQRYLAIVGMNVKSLAPQVADPKSHMEVQIRMIALAMSVPWRILMGIEVGQLAGEQDIRVWNRRLKRRQDEYVTPFILAPFIDRLISYGILPKPLETNYKVFWKDLNSPSDEDRATVAEKMTNALIKYVQGGVNQLIPPFYYLTLIVGMEAQEARAVIEAAGLDEKELMPLVTEPATKDSTRVR